MGLFDFIPTVPEVLDHTFCLFAGHDYYDGVCKNCGKKQK